MRFGRVISGAAVAIAAVLALSSGASAVPVTWVLTNVSWSDGTSATGSFVYDADTNTFSNLSLTTSGGSGIVPDTSSWVFDTADPFAESNVLGDIGFVSVDAASADETGAHVLSLFSTGFSLMTNAGGVISLDFLLIGTCADANCENYNLDLPFSFDGTGQFVAESSSVPEPITLSLFGAGLAGAVAMRRRKKAAA